MRARMDYGLEILVRMLYLEPAVRQRRILVLGQGADAMGEVLSRMGAVSVKTHVPGQGRSLPWDLAGLRGRRDADAGTALPVRRGEVDLVFIPDLAAIEDYRALLGEAARVLGGQGMLVLSVRNAECTVPISETGLEEMPEVWSLESLEQMLGQYFAHVDVAGQSPFLGYAMASYDPARGRAGVRLDTSLMDSQGEDPEFIVALCGHEPPGQPLSNALFQMPMAEMALVEGRAPDPGKGGSPADGRLNAELESLRRELGNRNVVVSRLEKEIERLQAEAEAERQRMFDLRQKMEKERKDHQKEALESVMRREVQKTPETWLTERATLSRELEEMTRERARAEAALARAQDELAKAEARAGRLEAVEKDTRSRMERSEARSKELHVQVKQLTARIREEETRAPQLGRRLEELQAALEKAERDVTLVEGERNQLMAQHGKLEREVEACKGEVARIRLEADGRTKDLALEVRRLRAEAQGRPAAPAPDEGGIAKLRAELERRDELIRDLIRELEVLPTIIEEARPPAGDGVHDLVGEVGRLRGENEDLARRGAALAAELDGVRAELDIVRRESSEAAALVSMVDDALGPQGQAAPPASPDPAMDRYLCDLEEDLRRIAAGATVEVARELGLVWVGIGKKRRSS